MAVTTLSNSKGFTVSVCSTGASVTDIMLPNGTHVVLGYQDKTMYEHNVFYLGCSVGRCTNRTANASFTIGGVVYPISANRPPNHLHGGYVGFDRLTWHIKSQSDTSLTYLLQSPAGDQGYPGNLTVTVTYTIAKDSNELSIEFHATTDAPTPVNLTNHSYFNLTGGKGDILGHVLTLNADNYTPTDDESIPTGEVSPVEGTVYDFRTPHTIGERCEQVSKVGYDTNYCVNATPTCDSDPDLRFVAKLEASPNALEVYSNQPCVQLYQGGYLDGNVIGADGNPINQYGGLCLETQKHPNAINEPRFPSTLLCPGQEYYNKTIWKFTSN